MSKLSKKQQEEVEREVEREVKKQLSKRLLEKTTKFGAEFKKQTSTAIIAAFGFLVALVWRDLIQKLVQNNINPSILESHPYLAALYTAIIVTLIAVIGIAIVSRWAKNDI